MINKLRWKFIAIATVAVFIVLAMILTMVNQYFSYNAIKEDQEILQEIVDNDGVMPMNYHMEAVGDEYLGISAELKYQMRYFSLLLSVDGDEVKEINLDHIQSVTDEKALEYGRDILGKRADIGSIIAENGYYIYQKEKRDDDLCLIVVLDCTREMNSVLALRRFSLWFGLACLILFFGILTALSGKVVEPVIKNMESQKQFITNASHELKTPIAIISANTEVLEMMEGENEWTASIMNQVQRLTGLVNNLITLSKMGEGNKEDYSQVDYSACVREIAEGFAPVIDREGKTFSHQIQDGISLYGRKSELEEIANILLDNAVKYCDEKGQVGLSLALVKTGFNKAHTVQLTVSNSYKDGENVDCSRFFERFYREDSSHSSEKSGYGIGLAMAQGFVEEYKGKISASWKDGVISFQVKLPVKA